MWPQQDYKWRDLCSALHRHRKHRQAHAERMGPWSSAWLWYKPYSRSVRVSHRPLQRYNSACLATRRSKLSGRDALPTQTCTQRVHPSLGSHGQGPPRHALPQVYTPGPGTSSYRASCRSLKPPFQGLQSQSLSPLEFSICSLFPFEALPCPFPSPFVPSPILYHRSCNITQIGLKIAILLPWPPNCYYHMHVTIHAVQKKLLFGIPYPLAGK